MAAVVALPQGYGLVLPSKTAVSTARPSASNFVRVHPRPSASLVRYWLDTASYRSARHGLGLLAAGWSLRHAGQ